VKAPDDWIPEVAAVARKSGFGPNGTEYPQRLYRLGTDERLAPVWKELHRLNQASLPDVFLMACCHTSGTVTRRQLIEKAKEYRAAAKKLRAWAHNFDDRDDHPERRQILRNASKVLDELANKTQFYESSWVVERKVEDAEVRGYVLMLSGTIAALYGKQLDKIVAAIATVAFEKPISVRNVQYWRNYSGDIEEAVKAAKNAP
jgi:hypothetical protein